MKERFKVGFAKIEKWIEENPDEELGPAFTLLIQRARQNETEATNAWNAIHALARGLENWPCRCGRGHINC